MNILVVDDEKQIIHLLSSFLRSKGHSVEIASSGETALDVYHNDSCAFQLVICDIRLPDIDGLTLYQQITKQNKTLPFIFMSGHLEQEEIIRSLESAGPVEFLLKPFTLKTLYSKIQNFL